ncbi:hypothetical protein J1N35_043801 [Gossypium stocksii]|uniref:Uncharacterized protein n=1 Tax=Gossypium stocksii TaxID=47602 RepID=A0A9D3ZFA9_9ROSI|nr:hypothetical protein J1N35_043801 [Gossypium stocksii]
MDAAMKKMIKEHQGTVSKMVKNDQLGFDIYFLFRAVWEEFASKWRNSKYFYLEEDQAETSVAPTNENDNNKSRKGSTRENEASSNLERASSGSVSPQAVSWEHRSASYSKVVSLTQLTQINEGWNLPQYYSRPSHPLGISYSKLWKCSTKPPIEHVLHS